MKKFIIDTFSSLNNQYLIRNYIFAGFLYFPLVYKTFFNMQSVSNSLIMFIFITLSYILYPFAIFVYDSVVETLMGNNVLIISTRKF